MTSPLTLTLLLTFLYLSVLTAALPTTPPTQQTEPSISPKPSTKNKNTVCGGHPLKFLCGDACYDPMEADCDPEFLTLTRFGEDITRLKKEAEEKKKTGDEKKQRRIARQKNASRAPPPPAVPKPNKESTRDITYVHAPIPPPH
ncbi:hypothetical protein TWF718_005510 [Orbilia javanica]|uniref:Uncharacterized protein n=1 Tax=Orbilia javanica TaxID=47235 RepID=A0AAN8N1L0_9PEZI